MVPTCSQQHGCLRNSLSNALITSASALISPLLKEVTGSYSFPAQMRCIGQKEDCEGYSFCFCSHSGAGRLFPCKFRILSYTCHPKQQLELSLTTGSLYCYLPVILFSLWAVFKANLTDMQFFSLGQHCINCVPMENYILNC